MNDRYEVRPELLDQIRTDLGLTSDEQLAHRLGCTAETVRRLRIGRQPSLGTALAISALTGVDVSRILRPATGTTTAA